MFALTLFSTIHNLSAVFLLESAPIKCFGIISLIGTHFLE